MSTRNERFNRRMRPFDGVLPDADRNAALSDRGQAVERMLDRLDGTAKEDGERELADDVMLLMWAVLLAASGHGRLIPVLRLIARNGSDRAASVRALRLETRSTKSAARRRYFRSRDMLATMFVWSNKDRASLVL